MENDGIEKKKKKPIMKWVILCLVVLIAIAIFSDNQTKTTGTPKKGTSTSESDKKENKSEYKQNEVVTADGVDYEVLKVSKKAPGQYESVKKGYEYVVVEVKITNNKSDKISYNPFDWKMENSKGQESDHSILLTGSKETLDSGNLVPGGSVKGELAFEQPKNDKGLKLNYYQNMLFDSKPTFKIKID